MNPETFFDKFGLLVDTPNGVQKLRELILQLAVQGKLVLQDPNDEPAAVLLKKIKAEKERLVKEGKIRKPKKLPGISEDEILFDLPICWEWSRLNDLGTIFNGNSVNSHKKTIYSKVKEGMPYIATKDVGYGSLDIGYNNGIKIPFGEEKFKVAHTNSILICSEGGSAGKKIGLINRDICFGNKLFANETFNGVLPKYVFYLYQSPFFKSSFSEKMTGIIGGISLFNFLSLVVPLPPLNEQKRIVTRVDQLMALCDELEARQQKKQEARLRLNSAALDKLLTAHEPAEFANHWQRVCDNFDLLYDNPETVGELRKAILQLAVQGKLVAQDENDELAAVLLEKIEAEKERLVKGNVKTRQFSQIKDDSLLYNIPIGWLWVNTDSVSNVLDPQPSHRTPPRIEGGIPYIGMGDIDKNSIINFRNARKVSDDVYKEHKERYQLKNGDFIFGKIGTVGKPVMLSEPFNYTLSANVVLIQPRNELINSDYLYYYMSSPVMENMLNASRRITTHAAFGIKRIRKLPVPFPPKNEQRRIVAKIDQLMALCDELESRLNQSQTDGAKLMEAVVAELVGA